MQEIKNQATVSLAEGGAKRGRQQCDKNGCRTRATCQDWRMRTMAHIEEAPVERVVSEALPEPVPGAWGHLSMGP